MQPTNSSSAASTLKRPSLQQFQRQLLHTPNDAGAHTAKLEYDRMASGEQSLQCPICRSTLQEAYMTQCGHSFCYSCIMQHMNGGGAECPTCRSSISRETLYPNFLLTKLVQDLQPALVTTSMGAMKHLQRTLLQDAESLTVQDIASLVDALTAKRRQLESRDQHQSAEMELLMEFLIRTEKVKRQQFDRLVMELGVLHADMELIQSRLASQFEEQSTNNVPASNVGVSTRKRARLDAVPVINNPATTASSAAVPPGQMVPTTAVPAPAIVVDQKRKKMEAHLNDLQSCYFETRLARRSDSSSLPPEAALAAYRLLASAASHSLTRDSAVPEQAAATPASTSANLSSTNTSHQPVPEPVVPEYHASLETFWNDFQHVTRPTRYQPIATLRYGDLLNSSAIVSSIEFDRDDEYFATAGVTKKIKVFEYERVIRDPVEVHYAVREMTCRSKISCISWNSYIKGHIASSDYEGLITLWDAHIGQQFMQFEEHEKRAWSVDFSVTDPIRLASGSDDTRVKIWCTNMRHSVATIESKANICCVKFNPEASNELAFGSADHHIHYYDLRMTREPLLLFKGHKKAVSYVKFLNRHELASASTDSSLKLWHVEKPLEALRTFTGHTNEKNFVGLTASDQYLTCGSEANAIFTYYKHLSKPVVTYKFGNIPTFGESVVGNDVNTSLAGNTAVVGNGAAVTGNPVAAVTINGANNTTSATTNTEEPDATQFVSSVCWKRRSAVVLAANSQGLIKVLEMV